MASRAIVGREWCDLKTAMQVFGVGRATVEKVAESAGAKRKIGRRAIYSIKMMNKWLEEGGDKDDC